jgi:tetratricopeptide (TPR) repeat protein
MATKSGLLRAVILETALALSLPGQAGGPGAGRGAISTGAGGLRTTPPATNQPSSIDSRRALSLTGLVMLDDGSPPPDAATIEISCGGKVRPYGVTDSSGHFTVNYGEPDPYATTISSDSERAGGDLNGGGSIRQGANSGFAGCELNARLPGFRSDAIQLAARRRLDDPNVGTIILHRLANVSGYTFSMTTMNAPKRAQKDYAKGVEAARKAAWPEAEILFRKAVTSYPKYAVCWEALGRTLEMEKRPADAQKAYEEAVQADPRFVTPHIRLMVLAGRDQRWDDVVKSATTVIQLDPSSYPIAYYFGALANLNLKREDEAEKNLRAGLKVDPRGTVPRLNHLMGTLLMQRKAYAEALPYLRAYLQSQPESTDAGKVQGAIAYAEKMSVATAGPDSPQH